MKRKTTILAATASKFLLKMKNTEMDCLFLLYCDKNHILDNMKVESEKFMEYLQEKVMQRFPPMRFLLEIDVTALLDTFPELGEMLMKEPVIWKNLASDVLYACLQTTIRDCDYQVQSTQVMVNLRLKSVPRLLVHPNQRYYNGLVALNGLLISVTKPTGYVYHSVWSCPEECEGNEVILPNIPKTPPKCCICKSVLFENSGMRRCGEQVTATIILKNEFLPKTFVIVDDLIPKLRLGSRYILAGVVTKKVTDIWSIEERIPLAAPLSTPLPKDLQKLLKDCNGIPWKFIYCLASSLGLNVCPLNCFMHLKISLILSLASVKANVLTGSSILHVLVAGLDTSFVGNIMSDAVKLADRTVILGTSNTKVSTGLIGSAGGVCALPLPLYTYNQKQTTALLSAIESGDITTDNGREKLKSAVWAQGMDFKKIILFNVASVFGFVCRGDYGEYSDEIVDFLLQNAVQPSETSEEETRALKDISRYLDVVAGLNVSLDENAERLLRSYFLAARKERQRGVSVGSMGGLVATTLNSARLCLRSVANIDDAVFAVWLHISGCPEPRFAPEEYLQTPPDIKKLQKIMHGFEDWLEDFIGNANKVI